MSKSKKLYNNTLVFAVGNLGNKFIFLLLVPLYTYNLTVSEYGLADIITTSISLLLPLVSLSIFDAVFRFTMDKNTNKISNLTNGLIVCLVGFFGFLMLFLPFLTLIQIEKLVIIMFLILLFFQLVNSVFMQFIRAIGKIKLFAFNGIFLALIILLSNILFLIFFSLGLYGYLLSLVIGQLFSFLLLLFKGALYNYFDLKLINKDYIKKMLIYSLPLIPNAIMWWFMNLSDRYMILYFQGTAANGLYAVATKIPSLLMIINSIFFQAWQISAVEEFESKKKSEFYSKVFNSLSSILFVGVTLLLLLVKPILALVVSENFFDAWYLVPFLLLGVTFSSFSAFLGTNYIAAKETAGVFKTSMIGALTNILLNFILLPMIGIIGAAVATFLSFFITWVFRVKDTRKYVVINLEWKRFGTTLFLVLLQSILLIIEFNYLFQVVIAIIVLGLNINSITLLIKMFGGRLRAK